MDLIPSVWILSFIVNLFFLYAVFETKFQSPVVQVDKIHRGIESSGIKRVVFFVGDGLRADLFFENPNLHPRLTQLMNSGTSQWGISDTRVPTESRPGHIALFAGFYEDPSAIFTGWKDNLVQFDNVFNRSDSIIALGSPDVVNMFAKGVPGKKFYSETYPPDWQDFLATNSSRLDTWVFDKFKALIQKGLVPRIDKQLIFLHLLGIDNTGHAAKPRSEPYLANIALVDGIVSEVEALVKNYFLDDQTLFIFTSDHGMTDWGSHGDGSAAETETPFVIWGPGLKGETQASRLKQADIASLLSGVLQIPFPTNSVGKFPAQFWSDSKFTFDAVLTNIRQLKELMMAKKSQISKRNVPHTVHPMESEIDISINTAIEFAKISRYELAVGRLKDGIDITLDGINYYERYDQTLLTALTVVSFIIWIALIGVCVVELETQKGLALVHPAYFLFSTLLAVVITKGALGWSLWRVPYTLFPLYLSRILYSQERRRGRPAANWKVLMGHALCAGIGSEILVLAFYRREILTLGLFLNALWCMRHKWLSTWERILWLGSVALLGIFPIVPLIGKDHNSAFVSSGAIASGVFSVLILMLRRNPRSLPDRDRTVLGLQIGLLFAVPLLIHFPDAILTRVLAWSSIVLSFFAPVFISSVLSIRILSIFLGVATPFAFLSLSYESLFLPALFAVLVHLLKIETMEKGDSWEAFSELRIGAKQGPSRGIDLNRSFRLAGLHLFFVFFSFFGIGNIGSVSSFDPSAVRCFVSVFNPFVMMIILLQKILAPFLLVASVFRLLLLSKAEVERNFLIVLLLSQCMGLHMFLNVTNVGSWLEIGTSISHFVIVQAATVFILLLYIVANFLTAEAPSPYKTKFPLLIVQQKEK